jgi:hypothetical protein
MESRPTGSSTASACAKAELQNQADNVTGMTKRMGNCRNGPVNKSINKIAAPSKINVELRERAWRMKRIKPASTEGGCWADMLMAR